jgi:putative ABC transport system permease protein
VSVLRLAWEEMRRRKAQLVSGLLAITLGIAVIVGIRSVTAASEVAVAVKLDNLGANILVLPQGASVDDYYTADIDAPTIPEEYVERIVASSLPGVDNLSPKLTRRVKVGGRDVVLTGILPSSEIASKPAWQIAGLEGEELKLSCDPDALANVSHGYEDARLQRKAVEALAATDCLLGAEAAARLGLTEGGSAKVLDREFRVAKVLPATGTVDDDRVFVHLHALQDLVNVKGQVSAIEIMGCCNAISDGLLARLRNILPDTRITTISQIVSTQLGTNRLMKKVSLAFLVIVLFVGAISIGNFMWANVNERRRELGILRMIGAKRSGIYAMLLAKGGVLGILGGVLGFLLGTAAAVVLGPYLANLNVRPAFDLLPLAVLLSLGVALLGSWIPARLASRIEPFASMQEV